MYACENEGKVEKKQGRWCLVRLVAVKFEDYRSGNKVLKGVTGKVARQLVCLDNTSLFDLLKTNEPFVKRKEKEVSLVDYMFGTVDFDLTVESEQDANLQDLVKDKSVCGIGIDLEDYLKKDTLLLGLGVPIFVYVDCKDLGASQLVDYVFELRSKVGSLVFLVLDVDLSLMDFGFVEAEINQKFGSTRIRLVGQRILKLGGISCGGMFPSWFAKKYKLDFNYKLLHDITQIALLAEDFDYVDMVQDKVYGYNKIKEKE